MNLTRSNRRAYRQRGDAIVGILVVLLLLVAFAVLSRSKPIQNLFSSNYAHFNAVAPGWSEAQIVGLLGKPTREHDASTPSTHWIERGYLEPKRGPTGKVLIYLKGDLVCYCFLDKKGLVEETFIGGS
jgi:hypothetical protein